MVERWVWRRRNYFVELTAVWAFVARRRRRFGGGGGLVDLIKRGEGERAVVLVPPVQRLPCVIALRLGVLSQKRDF